VLRSVIGVYSRVQPNLAKHEAGFPTADALAKLVTAGQDSYGMAAVGVGKMTAGAEAIIRAAESTDPRPLWIAVWGGANTIGAGALARQGYPITRGSRRLVNKLRVYTISDQDDAGPWLRREFPTLHYIATPGDTNDYHVATWIGISGDEYYRNAPGADFTTVAEPWVNEHIRKNGPLGASYPLPCCIIEGDTPSFLSLMNNGLVSYMNPTFGGWGGRYVWRQPWLETRPYWTNSRTSRDTVVGNDGKQYTSDQATIWRWREAFQHDFAARMDWTTKAVSEANHNPDAVVNDLAGKAPLSLGCDRRHSRYARREQEPGSRWELVALHLDFLPGGGITGGVRRPSNPSAASHPHQSKFAGCERHAEYTRSCSCHPRRDR
jgi:hypothetical protein